MKKLILIVLIPIQCFGQNNNAESIINYYEKEIRSLQTESDYKQQNFWEYIYSELSPLIDNPSYNGDAKVYSYYIQSCYHTTWWSNGTEAYIKSQKNNLQIDTITKYTALVCFGNEGMYFTLRPHTSPSEDFVYKVDLYFKLFSEMIPNDKSLTCIRKIAAAHVANAYQDSNPSLFEKYNKIYLQDEKDCNECCVVNNFPSNPGGINGIKTVKFINTKLSSLKFKPNYGSNDSLKILGAKPNFNIDSFVNESTIWGNGIDTGIIGKSEVNISVMKDGTVVYGSVFGVVTPPVNQSLINNKYSNAFAYEKKLKEIFSRMPKWETTMKGNKEYGTVILTLWAK